MSNTASVHCIMGPTASGKSAQAMKMALAQNMEIISVDSSCLYIGMDIGTAKPSQRDQKTIAHHLLSIQDPATPLSAADYCRLATQTIEEIIARGKTPLLVGGTMLYFHMLQKGFSILPEADKTLREKITASAQSLGWPAIHKQLTAVDPLSASRIKPTDAQRIQRALEVYQLSGSPLSELQQKNQQPPAPYHFINHIIAPSDRTVLHQHIEKRFDEMLAAGFLDEVKTLYQRKDLHANLPTTRAVGYRQAWQHLAGDIDHSEMRARAIIATRQLAKRQYTWLKKFT